MYLLYDNCILVSNTFYPKTLSLLVCKFEKPHISKLMPKFLPIPSIELVFMVLEVSLQSHGQPVLP